MFRAYRTRLDIASGLAISLEKMKGHQLSLYLLYVIIGRMLWDLPIKVISLHLGNI